MLEVPDFIGEVAHRFIFALNMVNAVWSKAPLKSLQNLARTIIKRSDDVRSACGARTSVILTLLIAAAQGDMK